MNNLQAYINQLRFDFCKDTLLESNTCPNPIDQFEKWFHEAVITEVNTPNAMMVCTVNPTGQPSARILLLRNFSKKGFVFYTNYHSRKGNDLELNPKIAATFYWPELERQVRLEGTVQKQTTEESDQYFALRPDTSKLGAWTSPQSQVIESRATLEKEYEKLSSVFTGSHIKRPDFWGGYLLTPHLIEFWQGRPSRLHDRINYRLIENNWIQERLAP